MPKRKPQKELYEDDRFTEDRIIWKQELQRHCEEAHENVEETIEMQVDGIKKYKKDGDGHFTEEERVAEITVHLVLQAKAKMAEERVHGPEDSIVTEMIKQLPQENKG